MDTTITNRMERFSLFTIEQIFNLAERGFQFETDYNFPCDRFGCRLTYRNVLVYATGSIASNRRVIIESVVNSTGVDEEMHTFVRFTEYRFAEPGYEDIDSEQITNRALEIDAFFKYLKDVCPTKNELIERRAKYREMYAKRTKQ